MSVFGAVTDRVRPRGLATHTAEVRALSAVSVSGPDTIADIREKSAWTVDGQASSDPPKDRWQADRFSASRQAANV